MTTYNAGDVSNLRKAMEVLFDGELLPAGDVLNCEDGPKGWVQVVKRNDRGGLVVEGVNIATKTLHGPVEVKLIDLK